MRKLRTRALYLGWPGHLARRKSPARRLRSCALRWPSIKAVQGRGGGKISLSAGRDRAISLSPGASRIWPRIAGKPPQRSSGARLPREGLRCLPEAVSRSTRRARGKVGLISAIRCHFDATAPTSKAKLVNRLRLTHWNCWLASLHRAHAARQTR